MQYHSMLLIICAVFAAFGVFGRTLKRYGIGRLKALYFILCTYCLDLFVYRPIEEIAVSPACVFLIILTYGYTSYTSKGSAAWALAFAAVSGAGVAVLSGYISDLTPYAAAIAAAAASFVFKRRGLMAVSASIAPAVSVFSLFIKDFAETGYGTLELFGGVLGAQLAGILAALAINVIFCSKKQTYRTNVRNLSYKCPNSDTSV